MQTTNVRDELIQLRGLRFYYRDWASAKPNAQALVLLHGYTGHARSWDALARTLSPRYRVLALDQRGHGQTDWAPRDQYDTSEMITDLEAFVAALELENFALLGLSMGGLVSIGYAGKRPPQLAKLVIVDIAPEIDVAGLERIRAGVVRNDVFASRDEAVARAREDNPIPPMEHLRHRVEYSLMRRSDGRYTYRYDPALRDPTNPRKGIPADEGWKLVAKIAVPTLLVRGEVSDILSRGVAARMAETIPDCRLVEVAGSGHPVPLDKPDAFAAALGGFL
ncbi:MAG TPA: alpha/beta hydrolase [Pseudomonadales bacterium]|nr:alpha/beta hydrolase [Pseudomonadales bacterium]